jgi:hypothetical protein
MRSPPFYWRVTFDNGPVNLLDLDSAGACCGWAGWRTSLAPPPEGGAPRGRGQFRLLPGGEGPARSTSLKEMMLWVGALGPAARRLDGSFASGGGHLVLLIC